MQPFPLLVIDLADWLKHRQQNVICYLIEENRVLQEQFIGQRLLLTDDQRIRLAVSAGVPGCRLLAGASCPGRLNPGCRIGP